MSGLARFVTLLALAASACGPTSIGPSALGGGGGKADGLPIESVKEGLFTQQIDHPVDGAVSPGTFKQRYWYSTEFAEGPDSPVLFFLCGEAPCDPWYATTLGDSAKALKAAVVVLEHRYYGQSLPFHDLSLENMKYLTIHNAIEDAAAFQRWASASEELELGAKWIAVGGSYPGMLAAFLRDKHPDVVVGAWASSAPVDVSLSFWGYDMITATALGDECVWRFRVALGAAQDAYEDPERRDDVAERLFGYARQGSLADFLMSVSSYAMNAVQTGQQEAFCAALDRHANSPLDGVIAYVWGILPTPAGPLLPGSVTPLVAPAPTEVIDFSGSQWLYQVCTEVGFYQTHSLDQGHSVLSWLIDEEYWGELCQRYVGRVPDIEATRVAYVDPIDDGKATNLFFVNGMLDPWSALSYTSQVMAPAGVTVARIEGGSHCTDLADLTPDSPADVVAVHEQFYNLARQWLQSSQQ